MTKSTFISILLILSQAILPCHPFSTTRKSFMNMSIQKKIVVISPPNSGIGRLSSLEAAKSGALVHWFVVSSSSSPKVTFPERTFSEIQKVGGDIQVSGCAFDSVGGSLDAVSAWCEGSQGLICTGDGVDKQEEWMDAIKVASRAASSVCAGNKVVVLPLEEDAVEEKQGKGLLGSIFSSDVPDTLVDAVMGSKKDAKVCVLRHAPLFGGVVSSSDDDITTPFIGGPRRDPIIRDEYTMRSIRLESIAPDNLPTLLSKSRSSRLSIAEASSLVASDAIPILPKGICLTSSRGTDATTIEEWKRLCDQFTSSQKTRSAEGILYTAEFGSIPDPKRLNTWLETKWAPAILRTYELAGIRKGERPVYAEKISEKEVQIVFQTLVDFNSVTVGTMQIAVKNNSLVVTKKVSDGAYKNKKFQGEDVLLRSLADAVTQAVEKGLATKVPKPTKKKEEIPVKPAAVTTASKPVEQPQPKLETGPKSAGARRSAERTRGSKRKKKNIPKDSSSSFQ